MMTFVRFGIEVLLVLATVAVLVLGAHGLLVGESTLALQLALLTFCCALAGTVVSRVAETPADVDARRRGWE